MHQLFTYTITYIFIFRFLSVWLWNSLVGPVILTKCCVLHNAFVDVDMYVSHLLPISQTEHYIWLFSEIYALKQATKLVLSILCADIQIYYILGCGQNCLFLFLRIQNDLEDVIRRGEGTQDCCYLLWQNGLACQPVEDHHVIVDYTQFFFIVLCSFERGKNDGRKWQFSNKKKKTFNATIHRHSTCADIWQYALWSQSIGCLLVRAKRGIRNIIIGMVTRLTQAEWQHKLSFAQIESLFWHSCASRSFPLSILLPSHRRRQRRAGRSRDSGEEMTERLPAIICQMVFLSKNGDCALLFYWFLANSEENCDRWLDW